MLRHYKICIINWDTRKDLLWFHNIKYFCTNIQPFKPAAIRLLYLYMLQTSNVLTNFFGECGHLLFIAGCVKHRSRVLDTRVSSLSAYPLPAHQSWNDKGSDTSSPATRESHALPTFWERKSELIKRSLNVDKSNHTTQKQQTSSEALSLESSLRKNTFQHLYQQ